MKSIKHTDKELLDFYREHAGTEEHASYFVNKYAVIYQDIKNDPDYLEEGEELHIEALKHTNEFYLKKFLQLINIGHSPDWANLLAGNSEMEEGALGETFKTTKEKDASAYSCKYAEMIANRYTNYSDKEEDILYDEEHQKILEGVAHIK